jgi:DNA-binding protein H-NS
LTRDHFFRMEIMTKSYAQIVKQIETLKQDAERARKKEISGVVGRIREAISAYNLTAADLGLSGGAAPAAKPFMAAAAVMPGAPAKKRRGPKPKGNKPAKKPMVVKFRNDSGGTWGGLGKRPDWLRAALAAGKQLSDFAVK